MRRYFRKLVLDGLVYFLAGLESHKMDELRTALMHFADEQYVMVDAATTFRHVLPQCYLQRLLVYEKMANRNMIPVRKLIVNLAQNCRWAKIRKSDCVVPTLLTANSMLYSMGMGRMMLASYCFWLRMCHTAAHMESGMHCWMAQFASLTASSWLAT